MQKFALQQISFSVLINGLLSIHRTGKTIFTTRSAPDQLPFAESTSYPEGLSTEGDEPEKTETL